MTATDLRRAAGRAALHADDLARTDPAEFVRLAVHARAVLPTGQLDQMDAATDETVRQLRTVAAVIGYRFDETPVGAHPPWVTIGAFAALTGWALDTARTCLHSPSPARPEPVMAAAWRPDLIVCSGCVHLLPLPRGSTADRTCDGCGHVTAGPEHDDPISVGVLQVGPLAYQLGACRSCRWWDDTGQ